jgi:hypothetical protein
MPKGMVEVDVKTGRSDRFIGDILPVFGGSHRSGSFCAIMLGGGPCGWNGTNLSALYSDDWSE